MKKLLVLMPILLAGCAKVSDYQASCEQRYSKLSEMANCLDSSIKSDSRMSSASTPKLYVLAAKMLGKKVDDGEISDAQARLELQNLYVNIQRQEQADQVAQSQVLQQSLLNAQTINTLQSIEQKNRQPVYIPPAPLQNNNITTNCTTYGNQTRCNSY
ncbi:hypothetical protein [Klebsiella pneumoniae]